MVEDDLPLPGGGTLHVYDTDPGRDDATTVVWHHGTPNVGPPPQPLAETSARLGVRWLSFDRPGYGGSSARPGRTVASVADCVTALADHAGVTRSAVMGHSGGGPHALACAALLPERTTAAVTLAGLAPPGSPGLDWFGGMHTVAADALRAAGEGRAAKERFEAAVQFDPEVFTLEDHAALAGPWAWLDDVVGPAVAAGPGGLIGDLAYASDWGFVPTSRHVPILVVHGQQDRMVPWSHGRWLADTMHAEHRFDPGDGHISVLRHAAAALSWLVERSSVPQ